MFNHVRATTLVTRTGAVKRQGRPLEEWKRALEGHTRMHDGKIQDDCAACQELQRKLRDFDGRHKD
jgi:hypothetical protein